MKRCAKCHEVKPATDFYRRADRPNTLKSYCRPCQAEYCRNYYHGNRPLYMKRRRIRVAGYRARNREFILSYLQAHPCVDCGESDPIILEFDHVFEHKTYDISEMSRGAFPVARIRAEMLKCEVRCANCHRRKTAKQFGWYRSGA